MEDVVLICRLNTELKVLNNIKKQLKNEEIERGDLLILDAIKKYIEAYGWDNFRNSKQHRVQYNTKTNEGSFFINRRRNGNVIRGIFKISKIKDEIVIELLLIRIESNFYG